MFADQSVFSQDLLISWLSCVSYLLSSYNQESCRANVATRLTRRLQKKLELTECLYNSQTAH